MRSTSLCVVVDLLVCKTTRVTMKMLNIDSCIGCVVAGRLAYADPTLKVMLIEGGANNRDDPWVYR